jgi:trk system potassium uptake protein TrkH
MLNFRPILFVIGALLSLLSVLLLIPAGVDFFSVHSEWENFIISSFLTGFVGFSLMLTNKLKNYEIGTKQTFILTSLSLLVLALFGSLPFVFMQQHLSYTDAFFESVSGLTTTGSTIFADVEILPPGILLWRSMLEFIGGLWIIMVSINILPVLQIGGMQIFRTEGPDISDQLMPRIMHISLAIGSVYLLLNVMCAVLLWAAGMSGFDAVNHAMATISTGGFSTHNNSIGYYNDGLIDAIITFFMAASALPFILYVRVFRDSFSALWQDSQVRWFIGIIILCVVLRMVWLMQENELDTLLALRYASFNIVAILSTTGFSTYWTEFPVTLIFMLSVIGGCAGSTAGGIKIFRYFVLYHSGKAQITNLTQPHTVLRPRFNGVPISENVVGSVMNFFILFSFCFMALSLALSLCGIDFVSSTTAAAAALSNLGPAVGESFKPAGDYALLPDAAKWILCFAMFLGRLEIFTVVVLFSSYFWRS